MAARGCVANGCQFGKRSDTTASSFDEAPTPSLKNFGGFNFQLQESALSPKPVEGPIGPHLFRSSQDVTQDVDLYLSMSPMWSPEEEKGIDDERVSLYRRPKPDEIPYAGVPVRDWTPRHVASWMTASGFEETIVEKFRMHDISGAILMDLQLGDLKELGILSFGQRHRLWNEIRALKGSDLTKAQHSPMAESFSSPTHDPNSAVRELRATDCSTPATPEDEGRSPVVEPRQARRARRTDDLIAPGDSASIVAIEQLLPKPHHCSKGENCSKWQKQQRKLAKFAKEFPFEFEQIGHAYASPTETAVRPTSEAVPSVVASSDVLGPASLPTLRLDEDVLRVVQARDPQESVRQFLTFQHMGQPPDEPTTPPYEMFPPLSPPSNTQAPHNNLRRLPRLTIPAAPKLGPVSPPPTALRPRASPITAVECKDGGRPDEIYRVDSPASEMDVPLTAIPVGPIERDVSQSVPPDMRFGNRALSRSSSRAEPRRAPFPPISRPTTCAPMDRSGSRASHRPPPSFAMEPVAENLLSPIEAGDEMTPTIVHDVNHAGWMKKRKTKMLRHEWHENHFRLTGTRLAMHRDSQALDELESIDVDEYAVACSSLASNKLGAAFKSLKLSGKKKETDPAAFSFQLVPAMEKKGMLNAATGKTHHFAVKTRDERIDWMRELMLAKALKQKTEGCEVHVNGNMI